MRVSEQKVRHPKSCNHLFDSQHAFKQRNSLRLPLNRRIIHEFSHFIVQFIKTVTEVSITVGEKNTFLISEPKKKSNILSFFSSVFGLHHLPAAL